MINWKYKGKYYYFDHMTALQMIGFLILIPMVVYWSESININYLSITSIVTYAVILWFICMNCVESYEPYYFDEKGNKVLGKKPK